MLLEQHSSVCCSRTSFTALTCTTGVGVVVSAGILQAWVENSTQVLVPVFHLLLVQDCVGLLQGELQRERKPRDTKQGADWLLACSLGGWEATHDVFERLCDGQAGVAALHDHGRLHVLHQLGRAALQEALGALGLGLPVGRHG